MYIHSYVLTDEQYICTCITFACHIKKISSVTNLIAHEQCITLVKCSNELPFVHFPVRHPDVILVSVQLLYTWYIW